MRAALPLVACALTLGCNQPPEGLSVSLTPEAPTTADALVVSIDAEAVDPNGGDQVRYTYVWFLDDERTDNAEATLAADLTQKGQTWRVVVTPTDGDDAGATAEAQVVIANSLPSATVSIDPVAPGTDARLVASVDTTDADLESVNVAFSWTVDGEPTSIQTDTVPAAQTSKGQVWQVSVTPSDSDSDGEVATAQVTIGNAPPAISGARIEPSVLTRERTASCVGLGWVDPNGDAESYTVQWLIDGTEVATTNTLDLAPYARDSEVGCVLTPTDGQDAGEPKTADAAIIQNALPKLTTAVIGPTDPKTGTPVTAEVAAATDADGDPVTVRYSWRVNTSERSTLETLPGNRFIRGDSIQLVAIPNDGLGDGSPIMSNTLNAANTLPVVTSVSIAPEDPATDVVVAATASSEDADGDLITLQYEWYVDGSKITATGASIDGELDFDKHQDIYVVVTPSDSDAGVPVTSTTLTAVNTPPQAPRLAMSDDEPADEDDVVCEIDSQEPDLDGDTLSYTFGWTLDGSTFAGATTTTYTGDTIQGSDRSEGDEWVCIVTPFDGDDNGPQARRELGINPPTGVERTGTLTATTLQRGSMTGSSTLYNDDCGADEFVVGITADLTKTGGYFASLGSRCAPLEVSCTGTNCTVTTGTITSGTLRGGTGTVKVDEDCPDGEVMVGFSGRKGWYLDQLTPRCAPIEVTYDGSEFQVGIGTAADIGAVGGTGGNPFSSTSCATDMVGTRAVIGAAPGQADGFGLGCQELALTEAP